MLSATGGRPHSRAPLQNEASPVKTCDLASPGRPKSAARFRETPFTQECDASCCVLEVDLHFLLESYSSGIVHNRHSHSPIFVPASL